MSALLTGAPVVSDNGGDLWCGDCNEGLNFFEDNEFEGGTWTPKARCACGVRSFRILGIAPHGNLEAKE